MLVLRTVFLSLHVAGGVVGLLVGAFAIRPPLTHDFRLLLRRAYAAALVVLLVFLAATVVVDWTRLQVMQQVIYVGLITLAVYMVTRVFLSFRVARQQLNSWETKYMNHIYFTYISLWEGLVIVGLFDLGAPALLIAAVAVGVVILGAVLFNSYKGRLAAGKAAA